MDKTIPIKKGIFVIRFLNKETLNKALNVKNLMLDKHPVIVKQWEDDMDMAKINLVTVPTWIQLPNLPIRHWGSNCLAKIVELVGKPIKPDLATQHKERLAYARYLVEVPMDARLPDYITFENKKGEIMEQTVQYEWRPVMCKQCKKMGHVEKFCK